MPDFNELVKNLYTSKGRELTEEKLKYIDSAYGGGKEEEFVKNFYSTIGEELTEDKFNYIRETYLKKKEPTTPPSEIGGVPTSPLIFTSPSGGEKPKTENLFEEGRLIREKRQAEYDTFKNYEFTQKKLSGIDKRLNSAEIKYTGRIVDPSLKQSLVKEKEELSKKRFDTNIDAKLAYQNVQKELDKTLEGEIKDKGLDYFTRTNESGFKAIDVDKIDQYARNLSMMSGLADEGYFKDLVYNKMKSRVDYEIAKPKIEKTFNELYAKKYGKTPQQDVEQEFKKNFVAQKQIEQQFNLQVASVAKRIKNDANLEFEQIKSTFDPEIQTINQGYKVRANEIQQAANQLNAMAQSGQIAPQEYNANITKLQADLNQLNDGYKQQFNEATTQYLNAQRELNGKYAARYKRQIYELKSMADARLRAEQEKYQKQFKVSPELQKKYTETWAEATDKFTDSEEALKTGLDELKPSAYLFGQSFVSGLGNAIRSLSTSIGYDEGRVIGDYLANMYTLSNPEIKEAKDLLDMTKVLRSSGEMIGGMAPMIAGQTITALATGGLSIPTQLAVQGGLGFTLETAQIGGSMYDETFARTGSANEAEKAATSVMKNNLYLLPLYAVDGLPFIEKATLGVKSTALRGVVKGAVETGTEIPQEFFQSAFEDLARSNKEIKDLGEFITLDRLKNTTLNVIPSTFALGAAPTYISNIGNKWTEIEAKSLAAKQDLSRLSGTAMQQYMYDMYLRYGENFSKAYLSGLYQSNKIDEAQTAELTKTLDSAKQVLENSNKFKLNKGESKIYASLLFGYEKARAESEAATDDVVKQALTQTANQFKNIASNYLSSKKADFAVIVLPNNEQYVVTLQEANDMLNDESFAARVRAGEVNISPQSTEKTEEFNSLTNRLKNIADESLRPTDEGRVTTTEERIGEPLESGKGEPTQEDVLIGKEIDDTKDKAGLPSEVGIRQEPIQAEPIQEAGISEIATSGVLETDEEVTQRVMAQMKPITDEMARVEMEFSNNGYKIDWDYDNEITVTDKRGEIVDPEDLPENLLELAGQYEKATAALGNFDYNSYFNALQQSRQDIGGIETEFEEVKPLELAAPAVEPDALKDVESTAKALKNKEYRNLKSVMNIPIEGDTVSEVFTMANGTVLDVGKGWDIVRKGDVGLIDIPKDTKERALRNNITNKSAIEQANPKMHGLAIKGTNQDGSTYIELIDGNNRLTKAEQLGLPFKVFLIDVNEIKLNKKEYDKRVKDFQKKPREQSYSEAYHKAKADDSNPELVAAVEELLGQKVSPSVQVETKPQLEPEIKSNLEKIQEETGTNFREIQNVYNKYGEGKPLNEITVEDYRRAEAKRQAEKEPTEKQIADTAQKAGITPKNLRDLYKINRELFGLDRIKSLASAIAMDKMVGVMAKRANITKAEMYGRLKFKKTDLSEIPFGIQNMLKFQAAMHGSPYVFPKEILIEKPNGEQEYLIGTETEFPKVPSGYKLIKEFPFGRFKTEKIGTGEGAQAFGWGLYFTDLESIARDYATKLAKQQFNGINTMSDEDIQKLKNPNISQEEFDEIKKRNIDRIEYILNSIPELESIGVIKKGDKNPVIGNFGKQLYDLDLNALKNAKSISDIIPSRNLYKVSLHKGKTPSEYTWLEWDKPLTSEQIDKIQKQAEKEDYKGRVTFQKGKIFYTIGNLTEEVVRGKDLYRAFAGDWGSLKRFYDSEYFTEKETSLFLLRAGIDGIKYPAESIARGTTSDTARGFNYVVFDENAVSIEEVIKFQKDAEKARGAMMIGMDGQAVIYALTDPNVSTPLHEMAHVFEHYMTDAEKAIVQSWAGTKGWTIETSEKFARGFEKYLAEGKAPTSGLQKIFDKFKTWLTDIYNGITGSDIDIELNEPMREIYAQMLGAEAVKPAKAEPELDVAEVQTIAEKVIQARDTKRGYDKQGGRPKPTDMKSQREQKAQAILQDIDTQSIEYQNVKAVEENIEDIINDLMNNGSIESTDCVL